MAKRLGYIDIAKCIAIVGIIVGHMGLVFSSPKVTGGMPGELVAFVFTFHLPVFLVVSGFFFSQEAQADGRLAKKGALGLLLPYVVTSLLIIAGCVAVAHIHGLVRKDELVRWSQAALWGAGSKTDLALWNVERIGGIWYLPALFWAQLVVATTHRLDGLTRLLVLAICTAAAAVSARYVWLPLSIQSGLGCALYLYVGMLARKLGAFDRKLSPFVLVLFLATWGYEFALHGGGSLAMQIYPLGAITVLGGLCATFVIVRVSRVLELHSGQVSRFMQWIGRNTLPILCAHILEDNMLRWGQIGAWFCGLTGNWAGTWIVVLALRFAVDALLVAAFYAIPPLRLVYFPQARKARAKADVKQPLHAAKQ